MNISLVTERGIGDSVARTGLFAGDQLRQMYYQREDLIVNSSATVLLTDNESFYVEYWHRGARPNQIGILGGPAMQGALERHGEEKWNIAKFDGSAGAVDFYDVPGVELDSLYTSGGAVSPGTLLTGPDDIVPKQTKIYWTGRESL